MHKKNIKLKESSLSISVTNETKRIVTTRLLQKKTNNYKYSPEKHLKYSNKRQKIINKKMSAALNPNALNPMAAAFGLSGGVAAAAAAAFGAGQNSGHPGPSSGLSSSTGLIRF